MSLETLLSEKRSTIIKKWRDLVIGSYPIDAQRFFKKEKNLFSNPVGQTIVRDVEILYDELTTGHDLGKISSSLDSIIRIRAIQDACFIVCKDNFTVERYCQHGKTRTGFETGYGFFVFLIN